MNTRPRPTVLFWVAALGAAAAPAWAADRAAERAKLATGVDVQQCLERLGEPAQPAAASCPAFLLDAVKTAAATCAEVGGKPGAISPASVWSLDVNGDGRREFAYEIGANVACEGAWSVFSCGSLGCPLALVQERDGAWAVIGGIFADAPGEIEVLAGKPPGGYRDLKVGCLDGDPCAEYAFYQWDGQAYAPSYREVRGHHVDVAGSVHGLYDLVGDKAVLATPDPGGAVLERYDAATVVAIVGQAGDYYYVSPCNACQSGFVPKSAVRKATPGP